MLHFLNENKKYIKYENKYEKLNYIIIIYFYYSFRFSK